MTTVWGRCAAQPRITCAQKTPTSHKKIINFKNSGDRTHYEKSIAQHKSRWGDSRQCLQLTTGGRLALITHAKPDCHGANRRLEKADCTHTYRCEKIKMQRNEAFVKCTLMSLCTGQLARGGLNPHTHTFSTTNFHHTSVRHFVSLTAGRMLILTFIKLLLGDDKVSDETEAEWCVAYQPSAIDNKCRWSTTTDEYTIPFFRVAR